MARRKYSAPRRGSLGYVRKRTSRIYPRVTSWPSSDEVKLLGFPAYKVGMVSTIETVERKGSLFYGIKRSIASTVLETPPIKILAVRFYHDSPYGLRNIGEIWTNKLYDRIRETPQESSQEVGEEKRTLLTYLRRRITLPDNPSEKFNEDYLNSSLEKFSKLLEEGAINQIRVLVATRPDLTAIGKKVPEVLEIAVGGSLKEAFDYAIKLLGGYVNIYDVFGDGDSVDVIGVTKGKGFQGVVKRFGVKILPPKTKKEKRAVGSLGPWNPGGVMWTVPRYGQLGFFKRTEYNKQILSIIKDNYEKFNPKGGWLKYGVVKNPVVVLRGSVQGPRKRLLLLRQAIRPKVKTAPTKVEAFYYSRELIEVKPE